MSNIDVRLLDPDLYYLADDFCDRHGIPRLSPEWSKIVAAIDLDEERVVGIMVTQMVPHAEPIWIEEAYRGNGLWKEMADTMDNYLGTMAMVVGPYKVYNQPTHKEAEHLCEAMGYDKAEYPLYVKFYGQKEEIEQWQQQYELSPPVS